MQSAAAGPTGTAITKPITVPSTASIIGLKTKPGTAIARLQLLGGETACRRHQLVLRRHELELALAHRLRGLEHGEDRCRCLLQGAATSPPSSQWAVNKAATASPVPLGMIGKAIK